MIKVTYLEVLLQLQGEFEARATRTQQLQQVGPQSQHIVPAGTDTFHVVISTEKKECNYFIYFIFTFFLMKFFLALRRILYSRIDKREN